jgi:hypothetical protein
MAGTKRVPIARPHTSSLGAVLPLYQAALKARAKWRRYRTDESYAAAIAAEKALNRALGTRMWQISVLDIGPIYSRVRPPEEERLHDDWQRALAQLQALEMADREQRQAEREARTAQRTEPEREQPTPPPSSA